MKLCIAEKPSVARDLAKILGASTKKDGYFEGNGYWVSWTFGHLCTLKEPEDYNPVWKQWRVEDLPIVPESFGIKVISNDGVKKQGDARFSPEPEAYMDENFGGTVYIWEKEVTMYQKVNFPKTCKEIKATINYMICDETQCLPPIDVELNIPLNP